MRQEPRDAGDRVFVDFHLEVDGAATVDQAHDIGTTAETVIRTLFPARVEATAHVEPSGIADERLDLRIV